MDVAVPVPPAPGYHDSKAFPELDHQRIPTEFAKRLDRANSPEGHAREQASLRLPAQASGDDQVPQKEPTREHAREQASPRPPAQDGGDDKMQQEEPPQGHAREQASPGLPGQATGDDQVQQKEPPQGHAREQASPRLPAKAGCGDRKNEFSLAFLDETDSEVSESAEDDETSEEEEPQGSDGGEEGAEEDAENPYDHLVDLSCASATGPKFFGWTRKLSKFTGIDKKGFEDLVPALKLNLQGDPKVAPLVGQLCDKVSVQIVKIINK